MIGSLQTTAGRGEWDGLTTAPRIDFATLGNQLTHGNRTLKKLTNVGRAVAAGLVTRRLEGHSGN